MIGGTAGSLLLWIGIAAGGGAVAGTVLVTSGPLSPGDDGHGPAAQQQTADTPTAALPSASATAEPDTATAQPSGRLDSLAAATDTTGWASVSDDRVGVRLRVPAELHHRVRELPPLIEEFDPPDVSRYELEVAATRVDARTPRPEGTRPETNIILHVLFLPAPLEPIPFGAVAGPPIDQTSVDVLGFMLTVRDSPETELAPRRVVAQGNIATAGGTLHIMGIAYPGDNDELVTMLLGMLQSLEALR